MEHPYAIPSGKSYEYMRDVLCQAEPMTAEEEAEAFALALAGDEKAREEIILRHQRFVLGVAHKMEWVKIPLEDLVEAGNLGLVMAMNKFDPAKGVRFLTYARWWVRSEMQEAMLTGNYAVSMPRTNWPSVKYAVKYIKDYVAKYGDYPDQTEAAKHLGIERSFVGIAQTIINGQTSLDDDKDGESPDPYNKPSFSVPPAQHSDAVESKLKQSISEILELVPDRERTILEKRFWHGWTFDQIGEAVNLSRQGVIYAMEKCLDDLYFDDELKELWR